MAASLVAARHRVSPLAEDRFLLELPEQGRLLNISGLDALVLRVARHAGDAQELLLRLSDLARCPPGHGRPSLERGQEQGWLVSADYTSTSWPLGHGISRADSHADTAVSDNWLQYGSIPHSLAWPETLAPHLLVERLDGLWPQNLPKLSEHASVNDRLQCLGASAQAAAGAVTCMGEDQFLRRHTSAASALGGISLWPQDSLPALPACVLVSLDQHPGVRQAPLLLAPGRSWPPWEMRIDGAYGAVVQALFPDTLFLMVPVRGLPEREPPAPMCILAPSVQALRLIIRWAPRPEASLDLIFRHQQLCRLLRSIDHAADDELRAMSQRAWLQEHANREEWLSVYGLPAEEDAELFPPDPDLAALNELRELSREYARQLQAWSPEQSA